MHGRKVKVPEELCPVRVLKRIEEVVSLAATRIDDVNSGALRNPAGICELLAHSQLQQRAARDVDLIFDSGEPRAGPLIDCGGRRIERTQSGEVRDGPIDQKIAVQNV